MAMSPALHAAVLEIFQGAVADGTITPQMLKESSFDPKRRKSATLVYTRSKPTYTVTISYQVYGADDLELFIYLPKPPRESTQVVFTLEGGDVEPRQQLPRPAIGFFYYDPDTGKEAYIAAFVDEVHLYQHLLSQEVSRFD